MCGSNATCIPYAFGVKNKEPFAFKGKWDAWKETPEAVAIIVWRVLALQSEVGGREPCFIFFSFTITAKDNGTATLHHLKQPEPLRCMRLCVLSWYVCLVWTGKNPISTQKFGKTPEGISLWDPAILELSVGVLGETRVENSE